MAGGKNGMKENVCVSLGKRKARSKERWEAGRTKKYNPINAALTTLEEVQNTTVITEGQLPYCCDFRRRKKRYFEKSLGLACLCTAL